MGGADKREPDRGETPPVGEAGEAGRGGDPSEPVVTAGVPVLFPGNLFDGEAPTGDSPAERDPEEEAPAWWVCRTLSRQEKVVARHFVSRRVPFYLPLIKKRTLQRGRPRVSHVPMFTGYLFAYGGGGERLAALQTNRLASMDRVPDGEELIRDLRQIYRLIAGEAPITPCERVAPGQRVKVTMGKFAGIEGVVLNRRKKSELLVAVNYLQQGARMAIEDWMIEPIS